MAKRPSDRPRTVFRRLDGILLLDKPAGMSSNQALQRVRHLVRAEKGGHTGALDPLATGLLPLCFGEATKIAGLLLGASKAYQTVARLGVTTDTDDADGAPLRERPCSHVTREAIEALLPGFCGRILQRPPAYSALKRDGEALYHKARRGEVVIVDEREVSVMSIAIDAFDGESLRLRIECGSGTYVRSLVRDIGELLGCGAHVVDLRRSWIAPFHRPQMLTLDEVSECVAAGDEALFAHLLPIEAGLADMQRVVLDDLRATRLRQGQQFVVDAPVGAALAVGESGAALGLIDVDALGQLSIRRLFNP